MKNLNLRQTQAGLLALLLACSPKAAQREGGGDCPKEIPAGMACIPGGTYLLGTNRKDFKKELPELTAFAEHKVELSAFLIDKYEVTTRARSSPSLSSRTVSPSLRRFHRLRWRRRAWKRSPANGST